MIHVNISKNVYPQMKEANKVEEKLLEYVSEMLYTIPGRPTKERIKEMRAKERKYYKRLVKLAYKIVEWRISV